MIQTNLHPLDIAIIVLYLAMLASVGLYFSLSDWHHPDYPAVTDADRPYRFGYGRSPTPAQWERYVAFMHGQVRELLTGFGQIDVIWFDFSYPTREYRGMPGKGHDDWQSEQLLQIEERVRTCRTRLEVVDELVNARVLA